jgi:hypothetical protein
LRGADIRVCGVEIRLDVSVEHSTLTGEPRIFRARRPTERAPVF